MLSIITSMLVMTALPQAITKSEPRQAPAPAVSIGASAQRLKQRIHKMRSNLLLGGDKVRLAETEALRFYDKRIETIELGLDSLRADVSEKRTSYDLALERVMKAPDAAARQVATREALSLRQRRRSLEEEVGALTTQRRSLSRLISAVKARDRDRRVLAAKLEAATAPGDVDGIGLPAIGLAPASETDAPASLDPNFIADLMNLDPRNGRRVLFEIDPTGYWIRFPLQPPAVPLLKALAFPPGDMPGHR